jgi:hypothetical protein
MAGRQICDVAPLWLARTLLFADSARMSYVNRYPTRKRAGSAELVYLLVVLAAGVATAWWAGHKVGMDLSSLSTAASILGLTETGRITHGAVGYTARAQAVQQDQAVAPYCRPGQVPAFALGLSGLKERLGDAMGSPVECEHASSPTGDTLQQTTTGLAAYKTLTNTVSFTDGWRHWAITPGGFVAWEGTESDPPATALRASGE